MVSGRKLFMSPGAPNRVHNHSQFSQKGAHTRLMSQTTDTEVKPTAPPSWHLADGRPHLSVLRGPVVNENATTTQEKAELNSAKPFTLSSASRVWCQAHQEPVSGARL